MTLSLTAILCVSSLLAGMMRLGVASIATPVIGLFSLNLKDTMMPLSLWLIGLTAIAGAVAYTRANMVDWRFAIPLPLITAITAPPGVLLLQFVPVMLLWWLYAVLFVFLAWRMAFPVSGDAAIHGGPRQHSSKEPTYVTSNSRRYTQCPAVYAVRGTVVSTGLSCI